MSEYIEFIKGKVFHLEESQSVEFKAVSSGKPVKTIVDHAEQYVLGFLNAQEEGNIYFGIEDLGTICGVKLTKTEKDDILKNIPNKFRETDPHIPSGFYNINIHNVTYIDDEKNEELYIVQISIIKSKEKDLFRTSGGSIYLKKGTMCFKMNSAEITEEIDKRSQVHLSSEASKLDKKLEIEPNNNELLEERARIAKLMGDVDEMDKHYQKLLKLNPGNSRVIKKYSDAHKTVGDLEGALSILNEAIKSNNSDSSILKSKASILLDSDRLNEAYQSYQQALILYPDDYTIITQIGIALRRLGKYDESIKFLNYALAKSPGYRRAKYEKKITYYKMFKGGL